MKLLEAAIEKASFNIDTVISGTAKGVDQLGETWAYDNNKNLITMPADWDAYGKMAGYKRNIAMAATADALIVLWDGRSNETKHMINIAKNKDLLSYIKIIL